MIRYDVTPKAIHDAIDVAKSKWRSNATALTGELVAAGKFLKDDKYQIWGEIKSVFMQVQHGKCAICEKKLESKRVDGSLLTISHDVEHFRPKSRVLTWPRGTKTSEFAKQHPTGKSSKIGYYWLALDPQNYAIACKECNTLYKSDCFPIAGTRAAPTASGHALGPERAYLCYPIGSADADPSNVVTFRATTAVPVAASGFMRQRGELIIEFFGLNEREDLHRERAQMITLISTFLEKLDQGAAGGAAAEIKRRIASDRIPHARCSRAFAELWHVDRPGALRIRDHCREYALSGEGALP